LTQPKRHQFAGFYILVKHPKALCLFDLGLGKTKLILDVFRWRKAAGKSKRLLVLVPNVVNLEGWRMEIAKHAPDLTASYLEGSKQERLVALEKKTDLCLSTYMGLTHVVCAKSVGKKKDGNRKMQIDDAQLEHVTKLFDGVVWDECFPAGTLVDVVDSFGGLSKLRIEDIRPGEAIINAAGVGHVKACRRRRVYGAVQIQVGEKKITSSKNHPFFTGRGWVCAQELRPGDSILSTRSAMRMVREGIFPKGFSGSGKVLRRILRSELADKSDSYKVQNTQRGGIRKSEGRYACMAEKASEKSGRTDRTVSQCSCHAESGIGSKDDCHEDEERDSAPMERCARGKWSAIDDPPTTTPSGASIDGSSLGRGVGDKDGVQQSVGQVRLSSNLQGGCGTCGFEDCDRGGWFESWRQEGQDQGQKEGRPADFFRVESVEVLESGDPQLDQFRDADGELYFYDLAVTGHPSFSVEGLLVHNCTCLMNHRSLQFNIAKRMSRGYDFRVGLTGTPLGRDPQVLWPQFYVVDRGEALGETMGVFRHTFFVEKPGFWGGVERTFKKKMTTDLHRLMAHSSIRYSVKECLDLPPKLVSERPFAMTDEQWGYYQAVTDKIRETAADERLLDVQGLFIRLRQITGGFVSLGGEPSALAENPKLDTLMEMLNELPEDEKIVIFNEFVFSGDQIAHALKDRGITAARLYSGTKDKQGELRRFVGDPKVRAFVVNSQSGAHGLNLQESGCKYVAFYESPVSPIVRQQAEARVWRQGQDRTVFIYDLVARHTVDEKILKFLAEGRDLFTALVEGGTKLLKGD
jgi:hypothetical protein